MIRLCIRCLVAHRSEIPGAVPPSPGIFQSRFRGPITSRINTRHPLAGFLFALLVFGVV